MKIGIITFHRAHNYGAVLQAYGLQEYLKSRGHEVYVIDYNPKYFDCYNVHFDYTFFWKNPVLFLYKYLKYIFLYNHLSKRYQSFVSFVKNKLTLFPFSGKSKFSGFDYIVLGSDQIWNINLTGGIFDDVFWGIIFNNKVFSYAASLCRFSIKKEDEIYLRKALLHLNKISVRENFARNFLSPYCAQDISVVLDPVFLLNSDAFVKIARGPKTFEPFVLSYDLSEKNPSSFIADYIAKVKKIKRVHISGDVNVHTVMNKRIKDNIGPEEFLWYFKNASYVVTSSFHGTAFSLIFKKNFYTIKSRSDADVRYQNLLSTLNLESRLIDANIVPDITDIDYKEVDCRILSQIDYSKSFLSSCLV